MYAFQAGKAAPTADSKTAADGQCCIVLDSINATRLTCDLDKDISADAAAADDDDDDESVGSDDEDILASDEKV